MHCIVQFSVRQEQEGAIRLGLVEMRRNEGLMEEPEEKVEWAKGKYYESMVTVVCLLLGFSSTDLNVPDLR